MQASWHQDADKLTFIILSEKAYANGPASDVVSSMIGDVNVFLINHNDQKAAEVEVMIAEPEARGKGYGREAIRMMLAYAYRELGLTYFVVKIGLANTTSARLFKSLLFVQESVSEAFQEVTMVMDMSTSTVPRNLTTYSQRSLKERLAKDTLAAENE
ncbi:hypothetical protein SARC_13877 [Sphaeroforma arctica JP610]|uniref:N-acetyltransferase domain-containing protein n=1 Tax=Sphaeroforma arctica JP610 TaxID=667725 RepID=A0A0L0FAP6_9EUKA|nr:hypothetical protein SARC_13877 [Sphaeroforma arctica JP610]KNC73566.1 hypothetical protein SARC_13877 [Sphaeroforma arctica JP610]|eukprot:XP_014147468.1 hypothetical protein SARC_13877 [Sphaeroforma arctica JP610]